MALFAPARFDKLRGKLKETNLLGALPMRFEASAREGVLPRQGIKVDASGPHGLEIRV